MEFQKMLKIDKISVYDLPELAVLFKELSGNDQFIEKMEKSFSFIEKNENYILLGARINDRLAGSLMGIVCYDLVDDCRPFMLIENVVVSENFRGKGIGRELMRAIENICVDRNCYYTIFVSGAQRKEAHKFYESIGYRLDAVQGFKKFFN